MEKTLTGLFGSGPEADAKTARAQDFVKRYSEGAPDQGYSTDEAVGQLNQVLSHANSQQVEAATKKALNNMPENQRAEFGQFVNQLHARQSGGQTTSASTASVDDISRMFGQAGGPRTRSMTSSVRSSAAGLRAAWAAWCPTYSAASLAATMTSRRHSRRRRPAPAREAEWAISAPS